MKSVEYIFEKIIFAIFFALGLFQIVAYPFLLTQGNFTLLCIVYTIILSAVFAIYIRKNINNVKKLGMHEWKKSLLTVEKILFISLVSVQIFSYIVLKHSDADDNFYASIPNLCIETNKVLGCEPSMGITSNEYSASYRMVGYEVFVAYIAKFTGINTSTIFHTIIPVMSIIIYYAIHYLIGKNIFKEKWAYYSISISLLNLFGGYAVYSTGSFLLFRLGQGKSLMCNIVFSYMFYIFYKQAQSEKMTGKDIVKWIFILYAGISTSAVAIYLVPIFYGIYVVYEMSVKKHKNIKCFISEFVKWCIPIITIIPTVATVFIMIKNAGTTMASVTAGSENIDSIQIAKLIQGDSKIWLIYFVACLILIILGKSKTKMMVIVPNVLLFITVINPMFSTYVAKYITGTVVYWRVFWLFPMYIIIAMAFTQIVCRFCDKKVKSLVAMFILYIVILTNGKFIYNKQNYEIADNKCKISSEVMEIADIINGFNLKENVLLADSRVWLEIRQYTGKIKLLTSRYASVETKNYNEVSYLYDKLYNSFNAENSDIENIVNLCDMNYCMIYRDNYNMLQKKYQIIYEGTDYYIVKIDK